MEMGMRQKFNTRWVWYGHEFFLQGWAWDSETRPRPVAIPTQHQ